MNIIDSATGSEMMRRFGIDNWQDPGAEYATWNNCCVFAIVKQDGFLDIHMAMDSSKLRYCRNAGSAILGLIGMHKLRAVILTDRPKVCNYAARMGFVDKSIQTLKTINGSESSFFIMWREPGEYHGRCN